MGPTETAEILCGVMGVIILPVLFYNLKKYAGEKVSAGIFWFVFINLTLQVSTFIVLPLDILKATQDLDESGEAFLIFYWNFYYWVSFVSSLLILPFVMYYLQSGEIYFERKIKDAFKTLLVWTLIPAVLGLVVWIYWFVTGKISIKTTPATIISLMNAYGSLILLAALSYGLIRVPKRVWERRDIKVITGYHYFCIKDLTESKRDALLTLETQYCILKAMLSKLDGKPQLKRSVVNIEDLSEDERKVLDALKLMESNAPFWVKNQLDKIGARGTIESRSSKYAKLEVITLDDVAAFNYEYMYAIQDFEMADHLYDDNMISAYYYQNIIKSITEHTNLVDTEFNAFMNKEALFRMIPDFEYPWYRYLHFPWSMAKLVFFIAMSGLVFLGQVYMFSKINLFADMLNTILASQGNTRVYSLFIIVFIFFGYMIVVSVYSLFSLKIPGYFGFYKAKTDPLTYLSFVYYLSKLIYPLCFNTLNIICGGKESILKQTSFHSAIENLKAVPVLGVDVPKYLPIWFFLLIFLFMFDFFQKALKWLGFKIYEYSLNGDWCSVTKEGESVLAKERSMFLDDYEAKQAGKDAIKRDSKMPDRDASASFMKEPLLN